jgi:hypothetical protein
MYTYICIYASTYDDLRDDAPLGFKHVKDIIKIKILV